MASTNASRPTAIRRRSETLLPPTHATQYISIEYSVHTLPASFKHELSTIFPSQRITRASNILLIPTMQKSSIELLTYGEEQENEKDRLLQAFFNWSSLIRDTIQKSAPGAWVDVTDPASGLARWGPRGSVYPEVDGFTRILKYPTFDAGGCRIIKHPNWGLACFPATLFTDAPFHVVREALRQVSGA